MPRPRFIKDKVSFTVGVVGLLFVLPSLWVNVRKLQDTVDLFFFVVLVLLSTIFFYSLVTNSISFRRSSFKHGQIKKKKDRFHNE